MPGLYIDFGFTYIKKALLYLAVSVCGCRKSLLKGCKAVETEAWRRYAGMFSTQMGRVCFPAACIDYTVNESRSLYSYRLYRGSRQAPALEPLRLICKHAPLKLMTCN